MEWTSNISINNSRFGGFQSKHNDTQQPKIKGDEKIRGRLLWSEREKEKNDRKILLEIN